MTFEFDLLKWAVLSLMGVAVWFMKRTLDKTEAKISTLETAVQVIRADYLHKSDFKDFKAELRGMFEEIKADIRNIKGHGG